MVTLFPVSIYSYFILSGLEISATLALAAGAISLFVAFVTSLIVASTITSPLALIIHALQSFQTRKSATALRDNGFDEVGEVSSELNRIFSEWNREVVVVGKKQFQQDKEVENAQYQIGVYENQLQMTRSCLKVAQFLNTTFDFGRNLTAILDEANSTMNVQWSSILLINRETHEMTVACVRGVEKSLVDDLTDDEYPAIRLKPNEGLAGQVIKDGLPLIANKGHKDARFKQFSEFKSPDTKIASLLCAPIKGSDGSVLGVMNFVNRISPPVFRNEDLPYIGDLCTLASLVIERNRMYKNLFRDTETGLAAHNVWKGYFEEESSRAVRYAQPLTILAIEVDGLSELIAKTNAEFGAQVIKVCGNHIGKILRDVDNGSLKQQTYYLLLPNTNTAGGVFMFGRLKESLEHQQFEFENQKLQISLSAGIACYPDNNTDPANLISAACKALTSAVKAGGDRACIYDSAK